MTTPVNIGSPRLNGADDFEHSSVSASPNIRAIRAAALEVAGTPPVPNIPPRNISSSLAREIGESGSFGGLRRPSVAGTPLISGLRLGASGAATPMSGQDPLGDLTDEEKARVLRRHLVSRNEREQQLERKSSFGSFADNHGEGPSSRSKRSSFRDAVRPHIDREESETFPIPYHTPGADLTHDIYKWQADQRRQARPRSASFTASHGSPNPTFANIHEPGGFRRNYLLMRSNNDDGHGNEPNPNTNNFIEFLYLYGHFAGEDLEEIEEEDEEDLEDEEARVGTEEQQDAEAALRSSITFDNNLRKPLSERTPLISHAKDRSMSRQRRKRANSVAAHGDATVTQAVLMLLKAFIGTGILFLGKAFANGGLLFSTIVLVVIALISLWSFLLLVKTKFVVSGSFGDMGGTLYGPYMRMAILTSIAVSQIGFVAAYTIFVAQNLRAFVMAVTDCLKVIPLQYFILAQIVVFLPFALIRNLAKLSTTALVADVFILAGLVYIFGSEFSIISQNGFADVKLFNEKDFPLLIGTAVFSFEGIGLVLPITDAMKEPRKFPAVLTGVMLFLTVLFGGAGALGYLTFGDKIQTVVLVNLDTTSKVLQVIQFLYSVAILLSTPLQLFPAVRIMENGLFTRSGKADVWVKWQKNLFRFALVGLCTAISWAGAADLDKFVSFVGSFACVPLCYVYPPMLHYKACAHTRKQKAADIALMIFGSVAAIYTTVQTIRLMAAPQGEAPTFGQCDS